MTAKRLTDKAIAELELSVVDTANLPPAIFGIVSQDGKVVRKYRREAGRLVKCRKKPLVMIPERLEPLLRPKPYKILYGGRGSAKSRTIASVIVERMRRERHYVLCCREIQKSIATSSYKELKDEIERKGWSEEFKITDVSITHLFSKSQAVFEGLFRNTTKIKGFAGVTICWVEEAENVTQASWDALDPTIRADCAELIISFNPSFETDPTWMQYVAPFELSDGCYEDDEFLVIQINHRDNPWFPDRLRRKRLRDMKTDNDRALWIWEGKFKSVSATRVFSNWSIEDLEPPENTAFYYGADWGFSNDPTTLNRMWLKDERTLVIDYEVSKVGVEIVDTPALFDRVPGSRKHTIRADSARPETISHMNKNGYKVKAAKKGKDSIEEGVTFLRGYSIKIHSRCTRTAEEFARYSYKEDAAGEPLPILKDAWNHHIDGIRYGLEPLWKPKKRLNA